MQRTLVFFDNDPLFERSGYENHNKGTRHRDGTRNGSDLNIQRVTPRQVVPVAMDSTFQTDVIRPPYTYGATFWHITSIIDTAELYIGL